MAEEVIISQNIAVGDMPGPIMSVEQLVSYGFKEYTPSPHDKFDRTWQFCLRTDLGKKLYVQVRLWAFSRYSTAERKVTDSFDAESHMNGPKTFQVSCSVNDMTPAQVVQWFESMHDRLGCTYYERYADDLYNEDGVQTSFNCGKCGRYLQPEEAVEPFLCPGCKYEKETGFKQPAPVLKKRRRRV